MISLTVGGAIEVERSTGLGLLLLPEWSSGGLALGWLDPFEPA